MATTGQIGTAGRIPDPLGRGGPVTTASTLKPESQGAGGWLSLLLGLVTRRLLTAVPVVLGVTILTFALVSALPGSAADELLGGQGTAAQIRALEAQLHLNQPAPERYWHWLTGALSGNLGTSLANGQTVASQIGARLPVTFELLVLAMIVSLVVAIPVAVFAAHKPNGVVDRLVTLVTMTGLSIAPYVLALVLVLVFSVKLRALPALGWTPPSKSLSGNIERLILPTLSLGLPLACLYVRVLHGDLVQQIQSEQYVLAARARGIRSWRILLAHALHNSVFSLIAVVSVNLSTLFGGTVIIEEIFGLPGMGQGLYTAVNVRDAPMLEGMVVVLATIVVVVGLLADVLYYALDPRIKVG